MFLHSRSDLVKNNCLFEYQQELHHEAGGFVVINVAKVMTRFVFAFFLHQPVFAVDDVEHVHSIVLDVLYMLEYCQDFTSHTPVRVQNGSLPEGLNEYPAQLPRLGQLQTRVGSKSLVMQDCKQLPRLITAPEYFGNLRREMSQVATQTFNVLYYFPFIWFIGSHYPRSYI